MGSNLVRLEAEYNDRFQAKKDELTAEISNVGRGFGEKMAELVQMQQAEILRLQGILHDSTALPQRHPVEVAIGSVAGQSGRLQHVLLAVASDRSLWLLENYASAAPPGTMRWARVPGLPQASDEAARGA